MAMLLVGFGILASLAASARFLKIDGSPSWRSDCGIVAFFAIVAVFWQYQVLGPAPFVVPSGDGGNVGSIVAAGVRPDRFISDPVFSESSNYSFYLTIVRPWVALNNIFSGDIGQAYMLMQFPILFIQLAAFFWLGRKLFEGTFWPLVLAVLSVPPVFIFNGELWGNLAAPLTRSVYGAIFPLLIVAALPPFRWWRPFLAMALCGISVYVHPVSAPSVALTIWLSMLITAPLGERTVGTIIVMVAAGIIFVIFAVPFAMTFVPSMMHIASPLVAQLQESARPMLGAQYYDAWLAVQIAIAGGGNNPSPTWGWLYFPWIVSLLFIVGLLEPMSWSPRRAFLLALLVGITFSSVGLAWIDQSVATLTGRAPVQIDIIRNFRFFVPITLIGLVWLLAETHRRFRSVRSLSVALYGLGSVLVAAWWLTFPNPLHAAYRDWRSPNSSLAAARDDNDFRAVIGRIREAPAGSLVLPLPANAFETNALAVRYGGFQPILYLSKDMNFLLYSASDNLKLWSELRDQISGLETRDRLEIETIIRQLVEKRHLRYVLLDSQHSSETLDSGLSALADDTVAIGKWRLYRLQKL